MLCHRLALSALALALFAVAAGPAAAGTITPAPVDFFSSPDGTNNGDITLGLGMTTIDLWADPTAVDGNVAYGLQDVLIVATDDVSIESGLTCDTSSTANAICLVGVPGNPVSQVLFTAGNDTQGNAAPFKIGSFVVNVTGDTGTLDVVSGTTLDGFFVGRPLAMDSIASVPEPGSLALVAAGLGLLARRR